MAKLPCTRNLISLRWETRWEGPFWRVCRQIVPYHWFLDAHLGSFNGSGRPAALQGNASTIIHLEFECASMWTGNLPKEGPWDGILVLYPRFVQDRQT